MSWKRKQDPVILIDSYLTDDDIQIPHTSKPLPVLLAPSTSSHQESPAFPSLSPLDINNSVHHFQHHRRTSNCSDASGSNYHVSATEPFLLPLTAAVQPPSPLSTNTYYAVIQRQSQEIQELRQDLVKLNQKYIEQIERIQTAEQAQFIVESELEDLSLGLFEQANQMVAEEKKARYRQEKKVQQLERELKAVYEELENEREQLNELRQRFMDQQPQNQQLAYKLSFHPLDIVSSSSTLNEDSNDADDKHDETTSIPTTRMSSNTIYLDHGWLSLFQDFLKQAPTTPLELLHRLPFMKQCTELDIEPCLRFGNVKNANGHLTMRKVLEAVIHQPCFIESHLHHQKRHSHDDRALHNNTEGSKTHPPVRRSSFAFMMVGKTRPASYGLTCYGCGSKLASEKQEQFRFRLKEQDTEWYWIDRACRDRLVAVCDFYVFIRHVRLGLQSQKTTQSLFQECVWLRLCMFWARSGVHHHSQQPQQLKDLKSDLLFVQ